MRTKWIKNKGKGIIEKTIFAVFIIVCIALLGIKAYKIHLDDLEHWDERVTTVGIVNSPKKESPIPSNPGRDYGRSVFSKVAENNDFSLYANFATGEIYVEDKITGKKWYSNPVDREEDQIAKNKNRLNSQLVITCLNVRTSSTVSSDSYAKSVQLGSMDYELLTNGVRFNFTFPEVGIKIYLDYCLCEDGLLAEVSGIEELWNEEYVLQELELLPYFGAGALGDEGYLFVPDGSGAIIELNNGKQKYNTFSKMVFGADSTFVTENAVGIQEMALLPVFGIKCNENAFLAVIQSGESAATIKASISEKTDSYNTVYSTAVYRKDSRIEQTQNDLDQKQVMEYSDNLLAETKYAVKYSFLREEQADYSGMAQIYKEYLSNDRDASLLADDNYLILDIYGAVSIEKYILGVKTPIITPLTTYKEVCNIVKELKDRGVERLIVNYIGAMDGGFENQIVNEVKHEKKLGTKKDFLEMIQYLEEEGVILFLESDPIHIYKNGNGYRGKRDGNRSMFGAYTYEYDFTLNKDTAIIESRRNLLASKLVADVINDFSKSVQSSGISGVSFSGIGEFLYSDMQEGPRYTVREESMNLWTGALAEAEKNSEYVMVHNGNAYCLPYVDVVTDVAGSGSEYDVTDQSIPFYQLAVSGNVLVAADAINKSVNYDYDFLKTIENGSCLKFNIIAADASTLVGTEYDDMVFFQYDQWKDIIVEQYLEKNELAEKLKGQKFVEHRMLEKDVYMSVYDSGTAVIVNYSDEQYQYGDAIVEEKEYSVIEEEENE